MSVWAANRPLHIMMSNTTAHETEAGVVEYTDAWRPDTIVKYDIFEKKKNTHTHMRVFAANVVLSVSHTPYFLSDSMKAERTDRHRLKSINMHYSLQRMSKISV